MEVSNALAPSTARCPLLLRVYTPPTARLGRDGRSGASASGWRGTRRQNLRRVWRVPRPGGGGQAWGCSEGTESILMSDGEVVKSPSGSWMTILATYRIGLMGDTELVVGELRSDLEPEDPLVSAALRDWDGPTYLADTDQGVEVALLRASPRARPRPWLIHGLLLLLTLFTTFMAGALLLGIDPWRRNSSSFGVPGCPFPPLCIGGAWQRARRSLLR